MTNYKRVVGSLLVIMLLIGIVPSQVFAEATVQLESLFVDQQFTYVDIYGLSQSGFSAFKQDEKYGYIDKTGQVVIPAQYDYCDSFNDGMAVIQENGNYGYINTNGEVVIPSKYYEADRFYNGIARVAQIKDGGTFLGYINKKGEEVIPVEYSSISIYLKNGYGVASKYDAETKKSTSYIVNTSGYSKLIEGKTPGFAGGNYVRTMNDDGGFVYYDFDGNKLNFDSSKNAILSNDLMAVQKDGKYGYIDKNGNGVIAYDYSTAYSFDSNGLAIVAKEKDNFYCIDKAGNTIIQPDNYIRISPFTISTEPESKKYYVVAKLDENKKVKQGCVDFEGNIVIPAIYESIGETSGFTNDLIPVRYNGKFGYVNKSGNLAIPAIYDSTGKFNNGLAAVKKDNKWGFIDTQGNTIIPFEYSDVAYGGFSSPVVAVSKDGKSGAIDTAGNTVIPFEYNTVRDIYITPQFVWTAKRDIADKNLQNRKLSLFAVNHIAVPTQSNVLIDGKKVPFDAFTVDGSNYFKLRDLAKVLNGTKKQFEIGWDSSADSITISTGKGYTSVGGELTVSGNSENKSAALTNSKILLDGKELKLTVYNINGSNYFKLRDLAQNINFGVGWDSGANTISVDTASNYTK